MTQNVQSFGVGSHQSVFNPVMNHLHEMAGAGGPTMEITLLDRATDPFPSRCARDIAASWSKRLEDWIEVQYGIALTSDHQTITALDPPHASARPHINIANTFGLQFFGSPDIINIVRVASIYDDISLLHLAGKILHSDLHGRRGHHQPDSARRLQLGHEIVERSGPRRAFTCQLLNAVRLHVEDHAFMAALQQAARHTGAHSPQTDHSKLHFRAPPFDKDPARALLLSITCSRASFLLPVEGA